MGAFSSRSGLLILLFFLIASVESFFVTISQNGPVVRGANITFRADVYDSFGQPAEGLFRYHWKDNAIPQHRGEEENKLSVSEWVISFPASEYAPGTYEVEVSVERYIVLYWPICSQRSLFNVTAMLNGELKVSQQNNTVYSMFISSAKEAVHEVKISKPDNELLMRNATSIITYWFIDCMYYGFTLDMSLHFNYSLSDVSHTVEALVVASYEPPTTTTTTTTTTPTTPTTTVTTTKPATTTVPTTSTPNPGNATRTPTNTTTVAPMTLSTGTTSVRPTNKTPAPTTTTSTASTTIPTTTTMAASHPQKLTVKLPFVCGNTAVMPDRKKSYGLFGRHITVRAPVSGIEVSGSNWLKHGDMVNLTVSFVGSLNFTHCIQPKQSGYNITGNETCKNAGTLLRERRFQVIHYFRYPGTYVLLMIISNDVSKVVYPVTINIYEVTKQAQLSVIVVPVTCSLLAVILVVFGVAYYVQSKNRYTVEVADFDFGKVSDMEYKTFRERLRESIANSINRPADVRQQEYVRFSN